MIWVTRLNGTQVVLNSDLIETVESTPDTVVTLVDGKKYVITESPADVAERVTSYRASILAGADVAALPGAPPPGPTVQHLQLVAEAEQPDPQSTARDEGA